MMQKREKKRKREKKKCSSEYRDSKTKENREKVIRDECGCDTCLETRSYRNATRLARK